MSSETEGGLLFDRFGEGDVPKGVVQDLGRVTIIVIYFSCAIKFDCTSFDTAVENSVARALRSLLYQALLSTSRL